MDKKTIQDEISEEKEINSISKLRARKEIILSQFSHETKNAVTKIIDELVCETIFQIHMELKTKIANSKFFGKPSSTPDESLISMAKQLSINNVNKNISCPKCFVKVKCPWISRHFSMCMKTQESMYSGRNSSRIARKRILEGFAKTDDDIIEIVDSDDEKVMKKRKGRKPKVNKGQKK